VQIPGASSAPSSGVSSSVQLSTQASSLASSRGGLLSADVNGSESSQVGDKQSGNAGSLATSEISSNLSAIAKSKIEAPASTQRNDNDVRLSDEGRQGSIDENRPASAIGADHEKLQLTAEIKQLSQRDQEVRNHERIHASIAGAHGGTPSFQFQRGPNGVLYAVSGSVSIDLSVVPGNAEATVRKAEQIERAALGPSDPSGADRAVAAKARSLANQARVELANDTVNAGTREESAIIGLGGTA
jgi:hypothetical protein